jgi:hypothetical protein
MVVLGDDDDQAVVDVLPPDLPRLGNTDRVLLDRLRLRRRHHEDRDLAALARLERGERLVEARDLLGSERAGEIGDASLERGDRDKVLRRGRGREQKSAREEEQTRTGPEEEARHAGRERREAPRRTGATSSQQAC